MLYKAHLQTPYVVVNNLSSPDWLPYGWTKPAPQLDVEDGWLGGGLT
jgi:hypothetical protein